MQSGRRWRIALILRKAPAGIIIVLELIQRFARPRHHRNRGSGNRRRLAAAKDEQASQSKYRTGMFTHINPIERHSARDISRPGNLMALLTSIPEPGARKHTGCRRREINKCLAGNPAVAIRNKRPPAHLTTANIPFNLRRNKQ